jgi:uncharacterized membrane protein (UPF0127 family)
LRPSFLDPILKNPGARWELRNLRNARVLASRIETAFDSPTRRKGLLGRSSLAEGDALIIAPCNSIHTFFMRFPLDAAFVARDGAIVRLSHMVSPWRIRLALSAFAVVELPAGTLEHLDSKVGDALRLTAPDLSRT